MVFRKRYGKKPAMRPRRAKKTNLATQVKQIKKAMKQNKPERKWFDFTLANGSLMGNDTPYQNVITYPPQGDGANQRVGNMITDCNLSVDLQFYQGDKSKQATFLDIYLLQNKANITNSYLDTTTSNTRFLDQDVYGYESAIGQRALLTASQWKVLKKVRVKVPMPTFYQVGTPQNVMTHVRFNCKIPSPKFNDGLIFGSVDNNPVQIAIYSANGPSALTFANSEGQSVYSLCRLTYTDV